VKVNSHHTTGKQVMCPKILQSFFLNEVDFLLGRKCSSYRLHQKLTIKH